MQRRFDAMTPPAPIQIVVVDQIGAEQLLGSILTDRLLPVVQDHASAHVWASWGASLRELWLVDAQGRRAEVVDLTTHPLTDPSNASLVQTRLLALAGL